MYKRYVKRLNSVDVGYWGVCWFLVCYSGVCLVVLGRDDGVFWLGCVGVGDSFLFFGLLV
jgi:hypothetical protein